MKKFIIALFTCFLFFQLPAQERTFDIYKNIRAYYANNPQIIEYAEYSVIRSSPETDTSISFLAYAKNLNGNQGTYSTAWLTKENSVGFMLLYNNGFYLIDNYKPQMIKEKKGTSIAWTLAKFPLHNIEHLEKTFGAINSVTKSGNQWLVSTNKYSITVDANTYRIIKLHSSNSYDGNKWVEEYSFILQPDSLRQRIKEEMNNLVTLAEKKPIVSRKHIERNRPNPNKFIGEKFLYADSALFNFVNGDSIAKKGKYVIYDFFFSACTPCKEMSRHMLDWFTKMDVSKLLIVGINPIDDEPLLHDFTNKEKLTYPIIGGNQAKRIAEHYKINSYPTLLLVAPNGTIKVVQEGSSKSFLEKAARIVSKQ